MQTPLNHDPVELQQFSAACEPDAVLTELAAGPCGSWAGLNHDAADLQRFAQVCEPDAVLAEMAAGPRGTWAGLTDSDKQVVR
jgi:hypothetical protein